MFNQLNFQAMQDDLAQKYSDKVVKLQNEYIAFCKKCGLKPRFDKTRIFV